MTARGIGGELRTVTFSLSKGNRDSVNEAAEKRLQARYGGAWTVVHCYWHNAPAGLIQTREWNGR
ncbi:hypothetical protein BJF78_34660 [Pseudonocardia sp. CNS-139]|nr:hypothetical protein BJF78_34660 [Pseudonocardia sp. CNS-139]